VSRKINSAVSISVMLVGEVNTLQWWFF